MSLLLDIVSYYSSGSFLTSTANNMIVLVKWISLAHR